MFAVFLCTICYCIVVHNAYLAHRRQNYTATKVKYWQKHCSVPTVANGPAVCLCLALRCWFT